MKTAGVFRALLALIVVFTFSSAASAQSRTWVSGVGDDANPCSRTAPCKTFAGAISKTAAGGIINVLDAGAYGVLTITKAITVQSDENFAGVLSSGTNGFIVNAGASDNVVIRGVSIEGIGSGFNGIRFLAGLSLAVENCVINRVAQSGISFEPSGNSQLYVKNTIIRNSNFGIGAGILIQPTATGTAQVTLNDVTIERNTAGLQVEGRSTVTVTNSAFFRNSNAGVRAHSTVAGAGAAIINLMNSNVSLNQGAGVQADGAGATVRISGNTITNNASTGISAINSGLIPTFGNNTNVGNNPEGAPTGLVQPQQ